MKNTNCFFLGMILGGVTSVIVVTFMPVSPKLLDMAQNASEYGCYAEARAACPMSEGTKNQCYDAAVTDCPRVGLKFREWIAQGKK
jgi:hypothetical protein